MKWEVFTANDGVESIRRADRNHEAERIYEELLAEQRKTIELRHEIRRLKRLVIALNRGAELSGFTG